MFKLCVMASGRGSNFASIVEKIEAGDVPAVVDILHSAKAGIFLGSEMQ